MIMNILRWNKQIFAVNRVYDSIESADLTFS